jgi:DNA-binding NarL/FixJ family response regulator
MQTRKANYTPAQAVKSCFRCGAEFPTAERERVCWGCRKPKSSGGVVKKQLTFREKQVVQLVAQGKANKEIAFDLLLTEGTIKEYLNRIFRKIEVSNRTELAIWALTHRAATESPYESGAALENRSLVI